MTSLIYRCNQYYMEDVAETARQDWNHRHRPSLWLKYRGMKYRPFQVGGQIPVDQVDMHQS